MTTAKGSEGVFAWKRRMGVHEAYHRAQPNRMVHWLCIPVELWAVVKLLSLVPLGAGVDVALVLVVVVTPIYLSTEPVIGAAMVAFLGGCWWTGGLALPSQPLIGALVAALLFAVTFAFQVRIGHGVFEEGRDDTEKNLAELARTKNPIPILLVFYYHLVELFLAAGYRPTLASEIQAFTEREIASWAEVA